MKGPLTFAKIKSLTEPGFYGDGGTLYLRIAPGRSKQWVQRLVIRGRRHDLGLGGWPLVSLQEARETAFENRKQARRGEDLLAAKQREAAPTFEEAVEKVIALHQPTWKDGGRTADSWRACLKQYAMPKIGRKRVSEITAADVLDIVGGIWTNRHETAKKVKRRLGAVLAWAVTRGYRSDNPVQAIQVALPKADNLKGHFKAIPHEEVRTAIETVRASKANPSTIRCFEFLILTATRSSEARLMTWEEVDLQKTDLDHSSQPERKQGKSIGCRCHHGPVRSCESPRPVVSQPWCFRVHGVRPCPTRRFPSWFERTGSMACHMPLPGHVSGRGVRT